MLLLGVKSKFPDELKHIRTMLFFLSIFISQPDCSLHLHLHVSENPYASGNIVSKESAPGIIIASGLVCYVE